MDTQKELIVAYIDPISKSLLKQPDKSLSVLRCVRRGKQRTVTKHFANMTQQMTKCDSTGENTWSDQKSHWLVSRLLLNQLLLVYYWASSKNWSLKYRLHKYQYRKVILYNLKSSSLLRYWSHLSSFFELLLGKFYTYIPYG